MTKKAMTKKAIPKKPISKKAVSKRPTSKELQVLVEDLRSRLDEAEETLHAIRSGEVDALVVYRPEGEQVYTLKGAERPYRVMLETMNEGALTLSDDGTILYCNARFAELVRTPLEGVIGRTLAEFVTPANRPKLQALLQAPGGKSEVELAASDGDRVLTQFSTRLLQADGMRATCVVVTDLTEIAAASEALRIAHDELRERVKELTALTGTARILQDESKTVPAAMQAIVALIPPGMQHPEIAAARIILDDQEFTTPNFAVGRQSLWSDWTVNGQRGIVEVYYLEQRPPQAAGPFLAEERILINTLAQMLRAYLDRKQAQDDLYQAYAELEIRVEERTTELAHANATLQVEIVERKHAQEQLALSLAEAQRRTAETEAIFAAINDAVLIYDTNMNVVSVNECFSQTYGFVPLGLNLRDVIQRASCRWLDGRPFRLEDQPTPRALRGEKVAGARLLITRPDGVDMMVETSSAPLVVGNDIVGTVTVWHDATERERLLAQTKEYTEQLKTANEQLREQSEELEVTMEELSAQNDELRAARQQVEVERQRYQELFEFAPGGYLVTDPHGTIREANRAAAEMFNMRADRLMDKPLTVFVAEPEHQALYAQLTQLQQAQETAQWEMALQPRERAPLPAQVDVAPMRDAQGQLTGLRWLLRDITERKQAEAHLRADLVALTRMHDLSTRFLGTEGPQPLLQDVMDAAVAIMGAQRGTLQLLEGETLRIVAHHGHERPFLEFFSAAENVASVCGEATRRGERVIISDAEQSPLFAGTPSLPALRAAGVRAIQSTPLTTRTGKLLGILTTQWAAPHVPDEHDLWRLDLLARQASDLIEQQRAEDALRESRQKYQALIETTSDLIWETDPQGRYTYCSPQMETLWGLKVQDMLGKTPFDLMPPDEKQRALEYFGEIAGSRKPFSGLVTSAHLGGGRLIFVETSGVPFFDAGGKFSGYHGISRDITERKRAEEALRASEERYRTLFESITQGVVYQDADGEITLANPAAERILGLTLDQMQGRTSSDPRWKSIYEDGSDFSGEAHPAMIALRTGASVENVIMGIFNPQAQEYRWVNIDAVPQFKPGEEKPYQVYATFDDITERKQAEQALRESEERFRSAFDDSAVPMALTAPDLRLLKVNPAYCRLLGFDESEVVGHSVLEFTHRDDARPTHSAFDSVIKDKRPTLRFVNRYIAKDGRLLWVDVSSAPVHDTQGKLLYLVTHVQDITERRQAEVALRQYADEQSALYQTSLEINSHSDVPTLLQAIIQRATELSGAQGGALHLIKPDGQTLELVVGHHLVPYSVGMTLHLGEGVAGRVAQSGRPLIVEDYRNWEGRASAFADTPNSHILGVPLKVRDHVIGVIVATGNQTTASFNEDHVRLLNLFAAQAAIAIENASLYEEAQKTADHLQVMSQRLVEAQETERRNVARELHDQIGQLVTSLKLRLEMCARLPDDTLQDSWGEAQTLVQELLARVRELSLDLRPAMLDDLGLVPALLWLFERFTAQTNIPVAFKHAEVEQQRFGVKIETAAYRITQEALTNVARHASASAVTVRLWATPEMLSVQIEDDGAGFDPEAALANSTSTGLSSMRERATLLGGHLEIESATQAGTRLTAELPLNDPAQKP